MLVYLQKNISRLISKIIILLYPNVFFYIQNISPYRYPIIYPMKISHKYPFISFKVSILDIHIDISLIYQYINPTLSSCILKLYLFRYLDSYPSIISHLSVFIQVYPKNISHKYILHVIPGSYPKISLPERPDRGPGTPAAGPGVRTAWPVETACSRQR